VANDSPALEIRFPAPGPDAGLGDLVLALLDDFDPLAIHEGTWTSIDEDVRSSTWRVHFADAGARARAATALTAAFAPVGLATTPLDVEDPGWAERTQAALTSVRVGRLVVAPPWDLPPDPAGAIIVRPSMGFGTGHHATTRLCLRALQELSLDARTVLDLGTGSGVLAIAAVRLGAGRVDALDCDPDALASARENLDLNGIADRVTLHQADLAALAALGLPRADVVVANLTAGVLDRYADAIRRQTAANGTILLSGVTRDQAAAVVAAFEADGVRRVESQEDEEEWVGLTLVNRAAG
jgi:ribosomal protein L11 methyltransferase